MSNFFLSLATANTKIEKLNNFLCHIQDINVVNDWKRHKMGM